MATESIFDDVVDAGKSIGGAVVDTARGAVNVGRQVGGAVVDTVGGVAKGATDVAGRAADEFGLPNPIRQAQKVGKVIGSAVNTVVGKHTVVGTGERIGQTTGGPLTRDHRQFGKHRPTLGKRHKPFGKVRPGDDVSLNPQPLPPKDRDWRRYRYRYGNRRPQPTDDYGYSSYRDGGYGGGGYGGGGGYDSDDGGYGTYSNPSGSNWGNYNPRYQTPDSWRGYGGDEGY